MTDALPRVPLREAARPVARAVPVSVGESYRQLGVRLWGLGAYEREPVDGGMTKYQQLYRAEPGDIVVNKIWARNGSVAVVDDMLSGCHGSGEFPMFAPLPERLDPRWMHWVTKSREFWAQCDEKSQGTSGKNRINPGRFLDVEIPLPPLDEQRRIVARIDALTAKAEEARRLKNDGSEEVVALYGRRVAEIFSRQQGDSWATGTLGDYVIDDCYGSSEKTNDDQTGTPILRMGNIQDGRLLPRPLKYLHVPAKKREKLLLKEGDILVNRTNSAELVGKCAVFNLEGEYGFASYIIRLRLDQARANPRLVTAYINSPIGRAYMFDERKQMTGQANVNATTLKKLPLPLPRPDVQEKIVTDLDALRAKVDAVKALQTESAAELDAMLPAILDKAFKGEL